jgi:hypothetical protein
MALIAAQHECSERKHCCGKTAANANIAAFLHLASVALRAAALHAQSIHAAPAARMNTYANPASNQNLATKLHHADKLCVPCWNFCPAR